jgi:hypothetical protein
MYRWLFTLIGVASLCPLVLVAQQEVQVHVESLIGNEAVTAPVPVRVTLSNKGALTRGTLEWRVTDRTRCFIPIVLPRGGRKQVELAVPVDAWQHTTSKKRKRRSSSNQPSFGGRRASPISGYLFHLK